MGERFIMNVLVAVFSLLVSICAIEKESAPVNSKSDNQVEVVSEEMIEEQTKKMKKAFEESLSFKATDIE